MKLFTLKKLTFLLTLLGFSILSLNAQQIGIIGNGTYIADNSGDSPALANFTDFGANTSRTFTIDNIQTSGNTTLNVTSILLSNTTDFTLSTDPTPVGVAKNGPNANFTIDFIGVGSGTFTSTVTVNSANASNDGGDDAWVFTIRVTIAPEIDIVDADGDAIDSGSGNSPATLNSTSFGSTDTLNPISVVYTIENNGLADLDITSWSSSNPNFAITTSPSTPVGAGLTTTIQITFTPTSTGIISSTITINNKSTLARASSLSIT